MNAVADFLTRRDQKAGFYCPACGRYGFDQSDMDLNNGWHHSEAMRYRYKGACCTGCTDAHLMTADGACMPRDRAHFSTFLDLWFSSADAMYDAEYASAQEDEADRADQRMYAGWRL
jgi:hypothetical protein